MSDEKRKSGQSNPEGEATQPARAEPKAAQPIKATVKQDASQTPAETIPTPRANQAADEIAATIAAPAEKDVAGIQREKQDVPAEWDEGQTILDLYEVKHVHTGGGMGLVYRVHHKNWNMDLAVKSPRANYFKTETQKENFIRECETWINLGLHPNIVSCYYVRILGKIPRVFAEYVEGGSLKDWIDDKKLYEGGKEKVLERILDLAIQFAWGLQYSHEKDLIHQDVKPANVMMAEDGTAKVTDFGLAKARATAGEAASGDAQQSILVSSGGMTPAYCSPEQANKQELCRKTDIWSWGLSVLEMFAGEVFWRAGQAAPEALESYLKTGAEDESIPKMPESLVDVLKSCFQHSPDDRPKDMQEVTAKLKDIYKDATSQEYVRQEPKAAELLADGLNNKAVSMLDLGRKEDAVKLYEEALKVDPHHPEATYNRGLMLWRSGKMADDELVRQLEEVRTTHGDDWKDEYLLGLVHIERGDAESAVKLLEEALKQAPDNKDIQIQLHIAQNALQKYNKCFQSYSLGHNNQVNCISISRDGQSLLSASDDNTLRLWNFPTGRNTLTIKSPGQFLSCAISADGHFALTGKPSGLLQLWDLATGQCVRIFQSPPEASSCYKNAWVYSVTFSPDERLVIIGKSDNKHANVVELWKADTGKCLGVFHGHAKKINSVSFSPDGHFVLSGSSDKTVRFWDVGNSKCLHILEGHNEAVCCVVFSHDGRYGLSGGADGTIRIWDLRMGSCFKMLGDQKTSIASIDASPDCSLLVSGHTDSTVRLWDFETGQCLRKFEGHLGKISSVKFSPDGHYVISASLDHSIRIWEVATGKCMRSLGGIRGRKIISNDGSLVLIGDSPAVIRVLNTSSRVCIRQLGSHTGRVHGFDSIAISSDNKRALSGGCHSKCGLGRMEYSVRLWDLERSKCLWESKGQESPVKALMFSDTGHYGISLGEDGCICFLDLTTGECLRTLQVEINPKDSLAISSNARFVVQGSRKREESTGGYNIRLLEVETGKCFQTLYGHNSPVTAITISANGKFLLSGSGEINPRYGEDNSVRFWELASGRCLRTFSNHDGLITFVSISCNGQFVLSESTDRYVDRTSKATSDKPSDIFEMRRFDPGKPCPFVQCQPRSTKEIVKYRSQMLALKSKAKSALSKNDYQKAYEISCNGLSLAGCSKDSELLYLKNRAGLKGRRISYSGGWQRRLLEGHNETVWSVAFSPDSSLIVSGDHKDIRIWDVDTGQCIQVIERKYSKGGHLLSLAFSTDGRLLMEGGYAGLRIYELSSGKMVAHGALAGGRQSFQILPGRVLVLSGGKALGLYDPQQRKPLRYFSITERGILYAVALSPEGRFALSASSEDDDIKLWDLAVSADISRKGPYAPAKCLQTLKGHQGAVNTLTFSWDCCFALSGGGWSDSAPSKQHDYSIRLWNILTGKCEKVLEGHKKTVFSVLFFGDKRFAVSGSADNTLRLWDTQSGKCLQVFEQHNAPIHCLAISEDARYVVSGCEDCTIRLWELDWDFDFPESMNWDDDATPYLKLFLTLRCQYGPDGISRIGKPVWNEDDFKKLLKELQYRGYGWLSPEGVRKKLEEMTVNWQGPPKMPWETPKQFVQGRPQKETITIPAKTVSTLPKQDREFKSKHPSKQVFVTAPKKPRKVIEPGISISEDFLNQLKMEVIADKERYNRVMNARNESELALAMGREVLQLFRKKKAVATKCPKCKNRTFVSLVNKRKKQTFHMCFNCGFDDRKSDSKDVVSNRPHLSSPALVKESAKKPSKGPSRINATSAQKAKKSAHSISKGIAPPSRILGSKIICTCGHGNLLTNAFCNHCGMSLTSGSLICDKCKMMIPKRKKTCVLCGCSTFRFQRSR